MLGPDDFGLTGFSRLCNLRSVYAVGLVSVVSVGCPVLHQEGDGTRVRPIMSVCEWPLLHNALPLRYEAAPAGGQCDGAVASWSRALWRQCQHGASPEAEHAGGCSPLSARVPVRRTPSFSSDP